LQKQFHTAIPKQRQDQAKLCGKVLGQSMWQRFPWQKGTRPMAKELQELVLNRTWRPFVELIGADGIPNVDKAGNVLRPYSTFKLSLRIPPRADAKACLAHLKKVMTEKPPSGAKITFSAEKASAGWDAPPLAGWLEDACSVASKMMFGKPCVYMGEGGTIPFMGMLGEKFPDAQFMITGVLGPQSNAHGPNEFLHIPMGKKLTACVAMVLQQHLDRPRGKVSAGKAGPGPKAKSRAKAGGKKRR
jgi:acetylornithine deacetylase/succinyl-diaminopimelate desuccinylase-like protein